MSDWKKGAAFVTDLLSARNVSINGLSKDWSKVHGYYRFLHNDRVSEKVIIGKMQQQCYDQAQGLDVIAIADTTAINCQAHQGRMRSKRHLGPLSDLNTLGYMMHPVYCVDERTNFPVGIANVRTWNRSWKGTGDAYHQLCITEKESDRWFSDLLVSRDKVLMNARRITFVMDREADHYAVLNHIPNHRTDVVVRSHHNRQVCFQGKQYSIQEFLRRQSSKGMLMIQLSTKDQSKRMAKAHIKWGSVTILKPRRKRPHPENTQDRISMYVVEVKETGSRRKDRLWWKLLTSRPVKNMKQAKEIIDIYKRRWQIEEIFRLMKTKSFNIENSALGQGDSLRKLGLFVLEASVKIAQLKSARDEESLIKTDTIFTSSEIKCLKYLNEDLQGNTVKLSNPYDPRSLSWASWIVARLGGWKGYQSQRPPGSITFKRGLDKFEIIHIGFSLQKGDVYKR